MSTSDKLPEQGTHITVNKEGLPLFEDNAQLFFGKSLAELSLDEVRHVAGVALGIFVEETTSESTAMMSGTLTVRDKEFGQMGGEAALGAARRLARELVDMRTCTDNDTYTIHVTDMVTPGITWKDALLGRHPIPVVQEVATYTYDATE